MMNKLFQLLLLLLFVLNGNSQTIKIDTFDLSRKSHEIAKTKEDTFLVSYKGKTIGHLYAKEILVNNHTTKDIRTNTDVDLFAFSVHVESEITMLKKEGELFLSGSFRHANRGTEDIIAEIKRLGPKEYRVKRNGEEYKIENKKITFCTADLYFKEPKGIESVFSSMYAEFLKLEEISPNKYKLSSPKSNDSYYSYEEGELILVEVDTPVGLTSCKRIK